MCLGEQWMIAQTRGSLPLMWETWSVHHGTTPTTDIREVNPQMWGQSLCFQIINKWRNVSFNLCSYVWQKKKLQQQAYITLYQDPFSHTATFKYYQPLAFSHFPLTAHPFHSWPGYIYNWTLTVSAAVAQNIPLYIMCFLSSYLKLTGVSHCNKLCSKWFSLRTEFHLPVLFCKEGKASPNFTVTSMWLHEAATWCYS